VKILIAPDKFKEACTAHEAAQAIAAGIHAALPTAQCTLCPLADGGDGTGSILAQTVQAKPRQAGVSDPCGQSISATWWWQAQRKLAIIEMAQASGLHLVPHAKRDPLINTSIGTGQLLQVALQAGAEEIWLGCGGSATVDGGVAMMQALGWRMLDESNQVLPSPLPPSNFLRIKKIEPPNSQLAIPRILVLTDVLNPLLGNHGAAAVYGPQKGANPDAVAKLETALSHWAILLEQASRNAVDRIPGSGAAGGIPTALHALLDAELVSGFQHIFDVGGVHELLSKCDLCVTGEGRLDGQSRTGKVVGELSARSDKPVVAFVGACQGDPDQLATALCLRDVVTITPTCIDLDTALAQSQQNLTAAAHAYFAKIKAT
jgi:glycerate kinase